LQNPPLTSKGDNLKMIDKLINDNEIIIQYIDFSTQTPVMVSQST